MATPAATAVPSMAVCCAVGCPSWQSASAQQPPWWWVAVSHAAYSGAGRLHRLHRPLPGEPAVAAQGRGRRVPCTATAQHCAACNGLVCVDGLMRVDMPGQAAASPAGVF